MQWHPGRGQQVKAWWQLVCKGAHSFLNSALPLQASATAEHSSRASPPGLPRAGDDVCGICRMPFDGCPPDAKYPGDDSPVVWGVCTHAFHLQCINR